MGPLAWARTVIHPWSQSFTVSHQVQLTYACHRVIAGSVPIYLNALERANVTPRMLHSSNERLLALPSVHVRQTGYPHSSFHRGAHTCLARPEQGCPSLPFKKLLKTQLFREHFPS